MPVIYPTWSAELLLLTPFATRKGRASLPGFVEHFHTWQEHWTEEKRALTEQQLKGTLLEPILATHQEELDELLMMTVKVCQQKSMILLAAGASPNAKAKFSKKRAISWVVEKHEILLLHAFIDKGVDLRGGSPYEFPLLSTAAKNSREMVQTLFEMRCLDETSPETSLSQSLSEALRADKTDIVNYLASLGANFYWPLVLDAHTNMHRMWEASTITQMCCTNPLCKSICKIRVPNPQPEWEGLFPLVDNTVPLVFQSCNKPMFDCLVELGVDVTRISFRQRVCSRGLLEYQNSLMDKRRLAVAMSLHERLGEVSLVGRLDVEVMRMILTQATPQMTM